MFKNTPLLSGLNKATWEDYKDAAIEFGLLLIFSFLPVLASVAIEYLTFDRVSAAAQNWTFSQSLFRNIENGELLIYAVAFLPSVIFVLYRYSKENEPFENTLSFILASIFVILSTSFLFGLIRSSVIQSQAKPLVHRWSIAILCLSLFTAFLSLVYNNILSNKKIDRKVQQTLDKIGKSDSATKSLATDLGKEMEGYQSE